MPRNGAWSRGSSGNRSSCGRRRDAWLRCEGRTRCCRGWRYTGLCCRRWMSDRWRDASSWRPSRSCRNNPGPRRCAGRNGPWSGRLCSNSGSNRSRGLCCRGSRCRGSRARRWSRLCGFCLGFLLSFRSRFCCREPLKVLSHEFGVVQVERARVSLLFGDADFRQVIDQDFSLDLEFSCQLVDADLIWI
jgi:hypothetical protein